MADDEAARKHFTIKVNNRDVTMPARDATGAQIKAAAAVPADFQLFHEHGKHLDQIADDEHIELHEGERFRAVSGQDVS